MIAPTVYPGCHGKVLLGFILTVWNSPERCQAAGRASNRALKVGAPLQRFKYKRHFSRSQLRDLQWLKTFPQADFWPGIRHSWRRAEVSLMSVARRAGKIAAGLCDSRPDSCVLAYRGMSGGNTPLTPIWQCVLILETSWRCTARR